MTPDEKKQIAEEIVGEISDIINLQAVEDEVKVGQILQVLQHHELIQFEEN